MGKPRTARRASPGYATSLRYLNGLTVARVSSTIMTMAPQTAGSRSLMKDALYYFRSLLRTPATEYTQFAAALALLGNLSPTEAATLLQEHTRHLQEQMSSMRSTIERGRELGVDRLFLVEDKYALTLLLTSSRGFGLSPSLAKP